jgi:hypothetical protein
VTTGSVAETLQTVPKSMAAKHHTSATSSKTIDSCQESAFCGRRRQFDRSPEEHDVREDKKIQEAT